MKPDKKKTVEKVEKIATGIEGLDDITCGGLPKGRVTLITGTAGSAKSLFSAQFLSLGIELSKDPGVYVTFEESPADIRQNVHDFWNLAAYENKGLWKFVDGSPQLDGETYEAGEFDLGGLTARILHAVETIDAKRLVIDSIGSIFARFVQTKNLRWELFRICAALKERGVTTILTGERDSEYGAIGKFGMEEFVADNVIILRNVLEQEKRRRTIEIMKYRGAKHLRGEYSFTIIPPQGIMVIPLTDVELKQQSSNIRVNSGNTDLDEMCGGGFFRDSIVLISGATGTGKTLMTTEFISGAFDNNKKSILFAFEESRDQLIRNAESWGVDYRAMENTGLLFMHSEYPEVSNLEDHLINIKKMIDKYNPDRIAVDSLSALERIGSIRGFREFLIALSSFIKHKEITALFTATTPTLTGGSSITEAHFSSLTDSIMLLRYVEIYGDMRRVIALLKMRGSAHDTTIREFTIDSNGLHIGKSLQSVAGILTGNPRQIPVDEYQRIEDMFQDR